MAEHTSPAAPVGTDAFAACSPSSGVDMPADSREQEAGTTSGASVQPTVKQPSEMTVEERSAFAVKCKDIGNRGFKSEDWAYAVLAYEEGIRYLQYEPGEDGVPSADFDHGGADRLESDAKLVATLFSNLAAAKLKMGDASGALEACSQALVFDDRNVKLYFRRGQAHLALGNHDAVHEAIAKVLELDPSNKEAEGLKRSVATAEKRSLQQEKALFAKMLA
eukprot:TRINITY_DN22251_c0_g1_i1.p1 TRINITY_DN22251_c0_g1~~TRINITY_DN22251_c0_g1_i1.p1  ORF type:complete len:221 (+),score=50.19 TRINITY_DN22251_c0_g1_i1:169-831(+)